MDYRRLEEEWRETQKAENVERAMDLLERQITDNLLVVRNAFAVEASDDPDDAFGLLFDIGDIKPEYQDVVEVFCKLGDVLVDIKLDRQIASVGNVEDNYLERYAALEEQVESAMRQFDGDYILRALCQTTKDKVGDLRRTFFGLWIDQKKGLKAVDGLFDDYVQHVQLGGDPVVIVEAIEAKFRAIQGMTADDASGFEEANLPLREILLIAADMESVFKSCGCNMDLLEAALSKQALYRGCWRQTDLETLVNGGEPPEGDGVQQLMDLVKSAWAQTDALDRMVESLTGGMAGQAVLQSDD